MTLRVRSVNTYCHAPTCRPRQGGGVTLWLWYDTDRIEHDPANGSVVHGWVTCLSTFSLGDDVRLHLDSKHVRAVTMPLTWDVRVDRTLEEHIDYQRTMQEIYRLEAGTYRFKTGERNV